MYLDACFASPEPVVRHDRYYVETTEPLSGMAASPPPTFTPLVGSGSILLGGRESFMVMRSRGGRRYTGQYSNAHPHGKFVFCTWTTDRGYRADDFTHLVYLYGDAGFCSRHYKYSQK